MQLMRATLNKILGYRNHGLICCTSTIYTVHLPLQTDEAAIYMYNVTTLLVRCGKYICTALTTVRFSYAACICYIG